MSPLGLARTMALALVAVYATGVHAEDISAKKILIKDNADPTKRQVLVLSGDVGVLMSKGDDPGCNGAAVHVYSTTDDLCLTLTGGPEWTNTGTKWKYKNTTTKNSAQIADGKLLVKIKTEPPPGFSLSDDGMQGDVSVQVQFGTGTRFCMRCSGNTKNDGSKFLAKSCVAAACDAEATTCVPPIPPPPTTTVVKGSLTATPGRFNYNATLGLPGANAACNTNFPGSHACSIQDLQGAPASDLACLKDTASNFVTSFWAIDSTAPALQQCVDDALNGSNLNWEYGTAHTPSRGEKVPLTNFTGVLGAVQMGLQCNISGNSWVGCCQ
jgi:hypothetical protein